MSSTGWIDVQADIEAASGHFAKVVALRDAGGFDGEGLDAYRAGMALMHALQSAHSAAEAGLLRVMAILGEERPVGDDWHRVLIDRLARSLPGQNARPALLSPDTAEDLHETRRFRHLAMHGYGRFSVSRAGPAIAAGDRLKSSLARDVLAFRALVDPD